MHAALAVPLEGDRAAAVRDDDLQFRKIFEYARLQNLHGGGIMVRNVIGVGQMHRRIERSTGVHRARHVELDQLFPQRIPPLAAHRRRQRLAPPRHVGIDVAADEAQVVNATIELVGPFRRRDARRLRQLADRRDLVWKKLGDARDQIVAGLGPVTAYEGRAEVMPHRAGLRRKQQPVDAGLLHAF